LAKEFEGHLKLDRRREEKVAQGVHCGEPESLSKVKEKAARESGLLLFVPPFVPNGSKF
jgi:hypothetical protein